ncbi:hemolysin family protein [Gryllotalpicola protaetiae]|uniref:HlyC/CorC family transporter n=1 Tax=Gryllotalpicola protaetiae TaxID=2419771 RepID=A0A387BTD0_9MICO|nr:hemolysin family protein [Gryllotalpicola protaetiae]AYG04320.1 HlyC/CorC family transporter [Gryllotalpicola protaetiae]
MNEWVLLGIGVVLIVGTGFFVASEFALVNLDRAELEARRERGESRLAMTIEALRHTSTHLSSAQLGITLTTLLTGFTLEPSIGGLLRPAFDALRMTDAAATVTASIVAIVVATLASMILGELVPKSFALALPVATARVVIPFQTVFTRVFRPAVAVLNGSANAVLAIFGVEAKEELSGARSAEELSSLVRRSAEQGVLEQDTASLLDRTLMFSGRVAGDVMTPRPQLETVKRDDTAADVIALAQESGYSRFPVIDDGIDDIAGIVHIKQAVAVPRERRGRVPVSALQSEALRVPETMRLDSLLAELRARSLQMAVVVDEYGGTAGVATLEDLVEELVGEVADEHDTGPIDIVLAPGSTGEIEFSGLLRPDELLDRAAIEVPEDERYETVAGFVMASLGRLPELGDTVAVHGGTLRVTALDGRRVDRLAFTPRPQASVEINSAAQAGEMDV